MEDDKGDPIVADISKGDPDDGDNGNDSDDGDGSPANGLSVEYDKGMAERTS